MARILNVGHSDYRVRVQSGGNIILDTGINAGLVTITGDLLVSGNTTTINTTNMNIEDNIIRLNTGEDPDHAGITLSTSGIEIDRGSLSAARFLFDENVSHYDPYADDRVDGTFSVRLADETLSSIQMVGVTIDPNVTFTFDMQDTTKTLRIVGSDNYESYVLNDNDIPNKKYINDYIQAGIIIPGQADVDRIYFSTPPGGEDHETARVQATATLIDFAINKVTEARIDLTGFTVVHGNGASGGINLYGDTITNLSGTLKLTGSGVLTNYVEIESTLKLDNISSFDNTPVIGTTKLYSRSGLTALNQTPGKTGIFISNKVTESSVNWNPDSSAYITGKDELVAKNRALLFSMLF